MYITFKLNQNIPLSTISTIMVLIDDYVIDKMCKFHDFGVDVHILTIPGNQKFIEETIRKYAKTIDLITIGKTVHEN